MTRAQGAPALPGSVRIPAMMWSAGGESDPDVSATEWTQRRNALRALLVVTVPGGAVFLALNLQLGATVLAGLCMVLIAVSPGLLVMMRRGAPLQALALVYLAVLFVNMLASLARPEIHPGAVSSVPMVPVLAYLLLESRLALPVTMLALVIAAGAYVFGGEAAPYRYEILLVAHVTMPVLALFVLCHFYARGRARSVQQMLDRVFRDPLTGLWNRDKLESELEREKARAQRSGNPLSILLIDLDHFKALNDRHGHIAGDAALEYFAGLMARRLREIDVACRIGGEEFAVLLPETDAAGAAAAAEDLRRTLEANRFEYRGNTIAMTLSAGVVELGPDGDDWDELYHIADARLYECKARGRNCVVSAAGTRDGRGNVHGHVRRPESVDGG